MTLKIGRIAYLNVAPYFHYLTEQGFTGEVVAGVPSELNRMLAEGTIDACPSSSYEYGLHAEDYLLLPGHSISSIGPVHSVLLFTPGALDVLSGREIAITGFEDEKEEAQGVAQDHSRGVELHGVANGRRNDLRPRHTAVLDGQ